MTGQEFAQKILEVMQKTDSAIEKENASVRREYELLDLLKEEIRELCQKEIASPTDSVTITNRDLKDIVSAFIALRHVTSAHPRWHEHLSRMREETES